VQTAIAAAASRRAFPISTLIGNQSSGSSLLVAQLACLMTCTHKT
jgi:nicotinamide riboside kinase